MALLAPLLVRSPETSAAPGEEERKLVVLFVESSLFQGNPDNESELSGKIYRYAKDVQNSLPHTRVLILPVSKTESPGKLFALLEKFYFTGYEREGVLFRLSGVVLVGKVPLPPVRSSATDATSIFPFTDFEDPAFLWSNFAQVFQENSENREMKAEVFHGLIRAPENEEKTESEWLSEYFDKNHAYHTGDLPVSEQALLFADFPQESTSRSSLFSAMYEAAEGIFASDLAFYRYNKRFLDDVLALFNSTSDKTLNTDDLPDEFREKYEEMRQSLLEFPFPDSLAREQILQYLPKYAEVTSGYLSDAESEIRGNGRWIFEEETADALPLLITRMDVFSREFLRDFSIHFEDEITKYVEENWQQPVPLFSKEVIVKWTYTKEQSGDSEMVRIKPDYDVLPNYFHGEKGEDITLAEECSLIRGTSPACLDPDTLSEEERAEQCSPRDEDDEEERYRAFGDVSQRTEMNHLWNMFPDDPESVYKDQCSVYGKCCILYAADPDQCNPDAATWNVFDFKGGKTQSKGESGLFTDCQSLNFLPVKKRIALKKPEELSTLSAIPLSEYDEEGKTAPQNWDMIEHDIEDMFLSGYGDSEESPVSYSPYEKGFPFFPPQKISSVVVHNEPRPKTIATALEDVLSGSLPADDDRRITFQGPGGNDITLHFPDIFDIDLSDVKYDDDALEKRVKSVFASFEEEMRVRILFSNFESYLSYVRAETNGLDHQGSQLVPIWNEKHLSDWLLAFLERADPILQSAFPEADGRTDLWIHFLDNADETLTADISTLLEEIPFSEEEPPSENSLMSFPEFVAGGGAIFVSHPYQDYTIHNLAWDPRDSTLPQSYSPWRAVDRISGFLDDMDLRETLTFPVVSIPEKGFLFGENGSEIDWHGGALFPEFLRWRNLTADEKHQEVIRLFFGEDAPKDLDGRTPGYEMGYFRADGDANSLWWGGEEELLLPGDDLEWEDANEEAQGDDSSHNNNGKEDIDKCTGKPFSEGVTILEWFPAFLCWLKDTMNTPVKVEMVNACSLSSSFKFNDHQTFDDILNPKPFIPSGSSIEIHSLSGDQIVPPWEGSLRILFLDNQGYPVAGRIPFSILPKSGITILNTSGTTDASGIFHDTAVSGRYLLRVQATSDSAGLTVSSNGFPEKSFSFSVIKNGSVRITSLPVSSGESKQFHRFEISVLDSSGSPLSSFSGTAGMSVSNPLLATVLTSSVPITEGTGEGQLLLSSGVTDVLATVPGFVSARISIGSDSATENTSLHLSPPLPAVLNLHESVEVQVLDSSENPVSSATLKATEKTEHLVQIDALGNGKFRITALDTTGIVRLVIRADDKQTLPVMLRIVAKITTEDFRELKPNAPVSALLGSNFADFSGNGDPIANAVLFSGRSQAVISSFFSNQSVGIRASVHGNGSASLLDATLSALPLDLSKFLFGIGEESERLLASYRLLLPQDSKVFNTSPLAQSEPLASGIYLESLDLSDNMALEESTSGFVLTLDKQDAVVFTTEGIEIINQEFSAEFETAGSLPSLLLRFRGDDILRASIAGASIVPETLPPIDFFLAPIPGNTDGQLGFSLTDPDTSSVLFTSGRAFEQADTLFAVGLHEDDHFALQLASGVPVGEAARASFGPSGILLGDPSLSFGNDKKLIDGFDRSGGDELFRSDINRIVSSSIADGDNDGDLDIFLSDTRGRVRMLRNDGDLQFHDIGFVAKNEEGIAVIATPDLEKDGFSDVIAIDEDKSLRTFSNREERFTREDASPLPNIALTEVDTDDFDADGFPDILAQVETGEVLLFWGSADGFSVDRSTELGKFGVELDETDLALENTLVSAPDIAERTKDLYPLLLGQASGIEEGMLTLADLFPETEEGTSDDFSESMWEGLTNLQNEYPDSFSELLSEEVPSDSRKIGIFADIADYSGISVSLFAKNESRDGNTVAEGDEITFSLSVHNTSGEERHFSLAHVLNPALSVDEDSLSVPETWSSDHALPRLEFLGTQGIRILNINLSAGETAEFSFTATMIGDTDIRLLIRDDLDFSPDFPADGLPDISVIIPGLNGMIHFLSQGNRSYTEYFEEHPEESIPGIFDEPVDDDGDGNPDDLVEDSDGDGFPDSSDVVTDPYRNDTDGDGIPDAWDETRGNQDETGWSGESRLRKVGGVVDDILSYSHCDGGCLNIPVNYAFLVPGSINLFKNLIGDYNKALSKTSDSSGDGSFIGVDAQLGSGAQQFSSAISDALSGVTAAIGSATSAINSAFQKIQEGLGIPGGSVPGWPIFGILPHFPYVCHGLSCYPSSVYRFYVSPTLTGGVGIGLCTNPTSSVGVGGMCMAFAPSKLNISALCDAYEGKQRRVDDTADGNSCQIVQTGTGSYGVRNPSLPGLRGLLFTSGSLGTFSYHFGNSVQNNNARLAQFPWGWVRAQIQEFSAMFQLPKITVYYPDFSGFTPKRFTEKFSDLKTTTSSTASNISDGVDDLVSGAIDGLKGVPDMFQKAPQNMQTDRKELEEKARESIAESKTSQNSINEKIESMEDIYDALNNFPLLNIHPVDIPIKVPHLSRGQILALQADLLAWKEDAKKEIERAKKNWANCPEGKTPSECSAWNAVRNKILVNADHLLSTVDQNLNTLENFLNQPFDIADIDAMVAQWINELLCFLDLTVLDLTEWFEKNRRRLEDWIQLYYVLKEIAKSWEALKDVFLDYERYCHLCKTDRGENVVTVFQMFFNAIVSPPIIQFPRLPDVTIDLSKIKGGINIPVPRPRLQFVAITFPKLPLLRLPNAPTVDVTLPGIPLLPDLTIDIDALIPPFPDIPRITLPDLPPAPRLPDFPGVISSLLSVIRPYLQILCLFKRGAFPNPEKNLKSIIEGLTARPIIPLLKFDLTGALAPDIRIPSLREIRIDVETNLDFLVDDSLTDAFKSIFDPWNNAVTDMLGEARKAQQEIINDIRSAVPVLSNASYQEELFAELSSELLSESLRAKGELFENTLSVQELSGRLGLEPSSLPKTLPAADRLSDIRKELVRLENASINRHDTLLAGADPFDLPGDLVPDSLLSADVTLFSEEDQLLPNESPEEDNTTFLPPEDEPVIRDGVFAECGENGEKIILNDDLVGILEKIHLIDFDSDGDKDMLLITQRGAYLKENHLVENNPHTELSLPEIGNMMYFSAPFEAVKNIVVTAGEASARIRFSANFDDDLLGIRIVLADRRNFFTFPQEDDEVYEALLLASRFVPEDADANQFVPEEISIEGNTFSGNLLIREFTNESVTVPLPADKSFFVRVFEIRANGLSTDSEIHFVMPLPEDADVTESNLNPGRIRTEKILFEDLSPEPESTSESSDSPFSFVRELFFPSAFAEESTASSLQPNSLESYLFPGATDSSPSETIDPEQLSDIPDTPGVHETILKNPDGTEQTVEVNVRVPEILLHSFASDGTLSGSIFPKTSGIPIFLFRVHSGWDIPIETASATESGTYRTDENGAFSVNDFSLDSGMELLDKTTEEVLALVSESTGRVTPFSETVVLKPSEFGGVSAVESETGNVLFSVRTVPTGNSDVRLLPEPVSLEGYPEGVYVLDRDASDPFTTEEIPGDADLFPGGMNIVSEGKTLLLLSREGIVRVLDNSLSLALSSEQNADAFLLTISQLGTPIFDVLVSSSVHHLFSADRRFVPEQPFSSSEPASEEEQLASYFMSLEPGTTLVSGIRGNTQYRFREAADLLPGDTVYAALISPDRRTLYSKSNSISVPDTLFHAL